jgi:hypothetical protein
VSEVVIVEHQGREIDALYRELGRNRGVLKGRIPEWRLLPVPIRVKFVEPDRLILPDGQITSCFPKWLVQPLLQKYFCFRPTQITSISITVPSQERGVAHVNDAGRDAVDAGSALDEWC